MGSKIDRNSRKADGYSFGAFEVRIQAGLLLRRGRRVSIQDLPFRMLVILLESNGEIVSREDFRNRLWGDKTFVEFGNNLRVAAAKLRKSLNDSVTESRYFETVPHRGYRFIGNATPIYEEPSEEIPAEFETPSAIPVLDPVPDPAAPLRATSLADIFRPILQWKPIYRFLVPASATLFLLAAVFIGWEYFRHRPLISSQDSVALGSIRNRTSEARFDDALSLPFRIKMKESPYLRILPDASFRRALRDQSATGLDSEIAACRSLGAKFLLGGEILPAKSGFTVRLSSYDCYSGRVRASLDEEAHGSDSILMALNQASEHLRLRLGENPASLNRFNVPLTNATSSSLAALRAFWLGQQMLNSGRELDAITYYKTAIDLDPQFALAYHSLALSYTNIAETSQSRIYEQKAFDLRGRTTDHDRLSIASGYYGFATGDLDRVIATYKLWISLYPNDAIPSNNLATIYTSSGDIQQALFYAQHATELNPSLEQSYATLAKALLLNGDFKTLKVLCDDKTRHTTGAFAYHIACYENSILLGNQADMQKELTWAKGLPLEGAMLNAVADLTIQDGQIQKARKLYADAISITEAHQLSESTALIALDEAQMLGEMGFAQDARALAGKAVALAPQSTDINLGAAMVWAILGDTRQTHVFLDAASRLAPQNTLLHRAQMPTVEAVLAVHTGAPEKAIALLESVRPYNLSSAMAPVPEYYRGLACLLAGRREDAIAEFNSLLRHRPASPLSPYETMAKLRLAQALRAEKRDAGPLLSELRMQWKDADTSFPLQKDLHKLLSAGNTALLR
jgi:DNA-binding winged helix-turn-helix (wHTH) protein/tetratricopeptide (TPR) repeat protein